MTTDSRRGLTLVAALMDIRRPDEWDAGRVITDEDYLAQLVYEAISAFVNEDPSRLVAHLMDDDAPAPLDAWINEFVDHLSTPGVGPRELPSA